MGSQNTMRTINEYPRGIANHSGMRRDVTKYAGTCTDYGRFPDAPCRQQVDPVPMTAAVPILHFPDTITFPSSEL